MNKSRLLLSVCIVAALAACSSAQIANKEGTELIESGQYEAGLARIEEGLREDPRDTALHIALTSGRALAVTSLLTQGDMDRAQRDFASARMAYGRVLNIEPNNRRAQDALRQLEYLRSMDEKLELARGDLRRGDIYGADRQVRQILELDPQNQGALELQANIRLVQSRNVIQYPQLRTRLDRPVTLEFRDANLKTIFEVLSQVAGLNFIFDKDLRPDMKATIFVRDVRIEDAVQLLLQQNQLHQKVVNENTLLIYPDSPQKLKDYQELVMRTFYLTSIDANTALNMIKTMLKTRDVFVDERLNTLTMRDSEDAIRMAEKLLQSQDQSNPEVVLEVEVMEVARQRILDLGLQWPNTFGVINTDGSPVTILDQLKGINSDRITISPSPQAKINAQDNDINTLASPVIRVTNREQARIHIGQRVPIISATSVPSTQGPVITESVTYLDVGLKLEVQPIVHLNNEVAIKIALEVSNATPLEPTRQGTIPVQVDTRNAQTTLRLHDGETQILAGLVRNDHGSTGNKIPGLGDIPGLGRLFGSNKDTVGKSELVLSITPRIVRNLPYQSPSDMEFQTGTETSMHVQAPDRGMQTSIEAEHNARQVAGVTSQVTGGRAVSGVTTQVTGGRPVAGVTTQVTGGRAVSGVTTQVTGGRPLAATATQVTIETP
ncbi:type II secretory pathway, component HofQ [Pseudomonas sp. GM21]|jgi:general secretion pathway protein D|uniref:secretin N-terminal domain-containing protein n=1 Tax=Pseudomonas TaxID=286 RepID=UPI0002726474|nr:MULTISPECIES: secretin N-terminal domain-containing protein [Pseudomonas]EJM22803.1 type II secretory pathway, component HofQ [Pseudomonas sp. GM21]MDR7286512.1 general secretion pathway protein D [Pseudomonas corrugata]